MLRERDWLRETKNERKQERERVKKREKKKKERDLQYINLHIIWWVSYKPIFTVTRRLSASNSASIRPSGLYWVAMLYSGKR